MKKIDTIYTETANAINMIAQLCNIHTYYDVMCGQLNVTKSINIADKYCSDKDERIIRLFNYYINNEDTLLFEELTNIVNQIYVQMINENIIENPEHLLSVVLNLYNKCENEKNNFQDFDSAVEYFSRMHLDIFENKNEYSRDALKEIVFSSHEAVDVEVSDNSIVFIDLPYAYTDDTKENIIECGKIFKWVEKQRTHKNVVFCILWNKEPNIKGIEMYTDFSDFVKLNKNYDSNYKLFIVADKDNVLNTINQVDYLDF